MINMDAFKGVTAKGKGFTMGDAVAELSQTVNDGDAKIKEVSIYDVFEHPENRSVNFEKVAALKDSILKDGLAQPAAVRVLPSEQLENLIEAGELRDSDRNRALYQHIAGWHRILALRELFEETNDEKWSTVPVLLRDDCDEDDEKTLRLLWSTNLIASDLTPEERGRGYEVLGLEVQRMREEHPDELRGARTNDVIADMMTSQGNPVSARQVARDKQAWQKAQEAQGLIDDLEAPDEFDNDGNDEVKPAKVKDVFKEAPEDETPAEVIEIRKALNALDKAISRLEKVAENAEYPLPSESIKYHRKRLRDLED